MWGERRQDDSKVFHLGHWPGADAFNQDWEFKKSKFAEKHNGSEDWEGYNVLVGNYKYLRSGERVNWRYRLEGY